MSDYLVITALGKDRPGIVNELSKAIADSGCNITDSRMTVLGGEFALILMIAGAPKSVSEMEGRLPSLEKALALTVVAKRTQPRDSAKSMMPYAVDVVSMDHPGIVHEVAQFFSQRGINIEEMETGTYSAAHTGTPMFSLHMTISVPADQQINRLREAFTGFCDDINLGGTLEPLRH